VGVIAAPSLGDLDGDGDLDLVAGGGDGEFFYFENTGTAISPAFAERTGAANPIGDLNVSNFLKPSFVDLDGDGDLDLVAGGYFGTFDTVENTGSATSPAFVLRTGAANPLNGQDVGRDSTPSFGDLDGDGDLDLVAGVYAGTFFAFRNLAGVRAPTAIELTGAANPLAGQDVGDRAATSLGDLDGDGDLDLVSGETDGFFNYFQNTGSAISPAFIQLTGAANPLSGLVAGTRSTPALGDLDGDGDLDLVAGKASPSSPTPGSFRYFANTGTATSPAFVLRTGAANPLGTQVVGAYATPSLGDLDGDGDLDLVSGNSSGAFSYFANTGSATSPAFGGATNPLAGQDVGVSSAPALGDYDGDGDLDLVSGEDGGTFAYFRNQGSATSPVFVLVTGAANPLTGQDVGAASVPGAGDLDGDGDLDLATGRSDGSLAVHYLPEPGRGLLLGAGIALLWGLERVRRWGRTRRSER
jgi:hypothetical protein